MQKAGQSKPFRPLKRGWRFWTGILLSLISLIWLIYTTDWAETWRALTEADYGLVLLAIGLNLFSIPLRTIRWRLMFSPHNLPPFGRLTAIMLIGQAINVIVPARLGDLVRASLVETERTSYVLGTLLMQGALDLLMLAGLVMVLLFQLSLPGWWRGSGQALLFTSAMALLFVLGLVLGRRQILRLLTGVVERWPQLKGRRLLGIVEQFLRSLDAFNNPLTLGWAIFYSLLIWGVYGSVNYVLLAAVGVQPSLLAAFFLLVVLQLGIAVPSSPGRIGVYHYLSVQALAVFGVGGAQALTFAIILHLISIIMPIILGAGLAWQMKVQLTPSVYQVET